MAGIKDLVTNIQDLSTVPTNFFGSLFGDPFNPGKPIQAVLTQNQKDYLTQKALEKGGESGLLSYDDYGTDLKLSDIITQPFTNPTGFSTALTAGSVGYKINPDTGKVELNPASLTYDFGGGSKGLEFIDKGGLMGLAQNVGGKIGDFFSAPAVAADLPGGGGGGGGEGPTTVRADYERAPNTAFAELLNQSTTPKSLNQFDNITNTGVNQRSRLTDRIKGGIETMRNKLGPIGDFFSKGGVMGNVISALGKRGDESTRGIAGLNLQDVFNIDSFGSDEDPTKDPYGINIVSARGNYKDYVTQKARELAKMKFKTDSANQRKDFYQQAFEKIQEQQRIEQAAQRARDKLRSEAAYATQTGDDSPYTGGFDPSTGNYDDPFSPGDTE